MSLPCPAPLPSSPPSSSFLLSPASPCASGTDAPATCEVPHFAPVRVRGGRYALRRFVRHRRRAVAAGLAVTAAAFVVAGPRDAPDPPRGGPVRGHPAPAGRADLSPGVREPDGERTVTAPVRIADAATVRLLRPGDRVDVIAAQDPATGGRAEVVARGARVAKVPEPVEEVTAGGALVMLSVPRSTAARLAGASATAKLAVALW
ncbi:hypothetical protein ACFYNZ_32980 [Streptomyces kebangsaanensis]|uniref:Flp pilus assembly protein RcpC/CpaB domain-containing protein n=1 Tax=Streptomyces kebangsaanensis TaxID=864058 RepID=A0ABW6L271_9ACTN